MNGQFPLAAFVVLKDFAGEHIAIGLDYELAKSRAARDLVSRYYAIEWRACTDVDAALCAQTEDFIHKQGLFFRA